jgi:hypothetical protein
LTIAVFASLGLASAAFLLLVNCEGSDALVTTYVSAPPPHSKLEATLTVTFLGRVVSMRTAADAYEFDSEATAWQFGAPIVVLVVGGLAGGLIGSLLSRWVGRAHAR